MKRTLLLLIAVSAVLSLPARLFAGKRTLIRLKSENDEDDEKNDGDDEGDE
jgi:hypothetical protein